MHPSSSNKYLSPELVVKKDNFKEQSFSKHFEILLHEHINESMFNNDDKNKQYYDNFLLALKNETNDNFTKPKKVNRKVNRKSVQLDTSTMSSLMKLKNLKLNNPSSPSNNHNKKPAINNINIYITKNKDDKAGSVYSSVKSSEDETKKLIVKKQKNNVYYSTFNSKNTINTEKKEAVNEVKKKKKLFCCIPIC